MTPAETADILRQFNEWQRGHNTVLRPSSNELGEAIDAAVEMIDRLEAAEKETASWKGLAKQFGNEADALRAKIEAAEKERDAARDLADRLALALNTSNHERDNLRAKIERMEKQEPVAWLHETRRDSDVVTNAVKCVWQRARPMSLASYTIPLYLAPGAKGEEK